MSHITFEQLNKIHCNSKTFIVCLEFIGGIDIVTFIAGVLI